MRVDRRSKLDNKAVVCYYLNEEDDHADCTVEAIKAYTGHVWYSSNGVRASLPPAGGGGGGFAATLLTPSAATPTQPAFFVEVTTASRPASGMPLPSSAFPLPLPAQQPAPISAARRLPVQQRPSPPVA